MAFQILNKESIALTMGELDKEAADFWGAEISEKHYATPKDYPFYINWNSTIGSIISGMPESRYGWADVISKICFLAAIGEDSVNGFIHNIDMYKPLIELCFYWQSKGYTPISC